MKRLIVTGNGTGVGKTVVSAILAGALMADYWKPIESGSETESDTATVARLLKSSFSQVHQPSCSFKAALAPQEAAELENKRIESRAIHLPATTRPLVIETVGGLLVPLNDQELAVDFFERWNASWIVVSSHYLGSINHTLLTIEALKQRKINIAGIIFNGVPTIKTEQAILNFSQLNCLGRLFPEQDINFNSIQKYMSQWKTTLSKLPI